MTRTSATTAALLALTVGVGAACGGITRFEDTTPLTLRSPVPPPESAPARVEVKQDHLEINEKIQFAFNAAEILPASDSLLGEIATTLKDHEEIKKIGIQGHTDSDGEDSYNKDLSQRRATAVLNWLKSHGVEQKRLQAKGFGESQPVADNSTPEGKEKNRRVEFLIVDQEGAK